MIVFNLRCENQHRFEGWFESAAKFEGQQASRQLACPVCGDDRITRELHAPYVNTGAARPATGSLPAPAANRQAVINQTFTKLVEHVLANTVDVGDAFPEEARKIHYREAPERAIRGNATGEELTELQEEGIEVIALPIPKSRLDPTH